MSLFAGVDAEALLLKLSSILALSPGRWLTADGRPHRLSFDPVDQHCPQERCAYLFQRLGGGGDVAGSRRPSSVTTRIVTSAAAHTSCASAVSAIDEATTIMVSAPFRSSFRTATIFSRVMSG